MMISKEALIDLILEWHLLQQEGKQDKADKLWARIEDRLNVVYQAASVLEGVTIESLREALKHE